MVGILTFVLLVCVDVVPKTLAAKFSVPVTLNLAYPIYGVQVMLRPLLFLMVPLIYSLTGGKGLTHPLVTEEELKIMLDQGGKAGEIESEEVKMIKNVFQLKEIFVSRRHKSSSTSPNTLAFHSMTAPLITSRAFSTRPRR
jgi:CBS domain containing-hemolysin-like protein